jgi:drug/metabolite transporter (DMT)-like permease
MAAGQTSPGGGEWSGLLQSGFLGFAVADTVYFAAIGLCGVQRAAMIGLLNVPLAALFGGWWGVGEPPTATFFGWMALVLAGVVLVLLERRDADRHDPRAMRLGVGLAFGNAFVLAVSVVVGREHSADIGIAAATSVRLLGGIAGAFVVAVAVALLRRRRPADEVAELVRPYRTRRIWPALVVASTFGSVLGLYPYHIALARLDPGESALTFAATPLFLLPLALVTGERPGRLAVIGTIVGFVGIAGITGVLDRFGG